MRDQPNVTTANRMTETGPLPAGPRRPDQASSPTTPCSISGPHPLAGDHSGIGGFLGVLDAIFEATNGQIELDQESTL